MGKAVSDMDLDAEGILYDFEGEPVTQVGFEVGNAAGALNAVAEVEREVLHKGSSGYIVYRYDVTGIGHDPVKDNEGQCIRKHKIRLTDAAFLDTPAIEKAINQQRARIRKARDAAEGRMPLFPDDE